VVDVNEHFHSKSNPDEHEGLNDPDISSQKDISSIAVLKKTAKVDR